MADTPQRLLGFGVDVGRDAVPYLIEEVRWKAPRGMELRDHLYRPVAAPAVYRWDLTGELNPGDYTAGAADAGAWGQFVFGLGHMPLGQEFTVPWETPQSALEKEAAKKKALALLAEWIGPESYASYTRLGWFEVTSSRGRTWRIHSSGKSGNVHLMRPDGSTEMEYCAYPRDVPAADAHLAQALCLVADEDAFTSVAYTGEPGTTWVN